MKKLIIILISLTSIFLTGCTNVEEVDDKAYYSRYLFEFNSVISFTIECNLNQVEEITDIFNRYDKECDYYNYSEGNLNDLNTNRSVNISNELKEVLEFSLLKGNFNNSFNMYSGVVNNLWKDYFYGISDTFPTDEEIKESVFEMNDTIIYIEGNKATLSGNGNIDLGAIAKGYAVKKVNEYLIENNITNYLINAGNSNILLGSKSDDEDFGVAIKNINDNEYAKILYLNNKSVVTSSIEGQSVFIDDVFYSHIIDPNTGYSNYFYDSITLVGDCAATLDVLSTSFFNLNLNEIKEICNDLSIDIVILKDDEILYESEGIKLYEKNSD